MKYLFFSLSLFFSLTISRQSSAFLSLFQSGPQHFGEAFSNAPLVTITELSQSPANYYKKTITITGLIDRQCPSAGCWLFLTDEKGATIRVELSDYFPKLPQKIGKRAIVEGEIIKMGEKQHQFIGTRITFTEQNDLSLLQPMPQAKAEEKAASANTSCH